MEVDVFNIKGKKTSTVEIPDAIFNAPVNVDLMHQAYNRQMANARLGTVETKTRGQVAGGGKRPWKQKGTGRARQGSIRAAQWVGGGRIHTPHMRDYTQAMPKKMRRAALRSALSVKMGDAQLVFVEDLNIGEPKTALMVKVLTALTGSAKTLVLIPEKGSDFDNVIVSARNITNTKLLFANYLNIRDLLSHEKVIVPLKSLDVIKGYLG
ncbi:MAG: 50S ribosomal protein L4 [Anaerolineaceae bacterium]|nr:50S ribosomal protein L4 [Anaerolineaceae bacterium]